MADALVTSARLAASGLAAQSTRLKIVAENLANAHSTSSTPGGAPYARKIATFEAALDDESGNFGVRVSGIERDRTKFATTHDPGHPAADAAGNVRLPNVNPLIEIADLREAGRSYQANLEVVRRSRELVEMTINLLRGSQ